MSERVLSVEQIMSRIRAGKMRGLEDAARAVAEQSDRNAPKDTGGLVESRRIESHPDEGSVEISYGKGLGDPRAVINHEKTDIHHDDGGPKYLERAMASELPKVRAAVVAELRKRMR